MKIDHAHFWMICFVKKNFFRECGEKKYSKFYKKKKKMKTICDYIKENINSKTMSTCRCCCCGNHFGQVLKPPTIKALYTSSRCSIQITYIKNEKYIQPLSLIREKKKQKKNSLSVVNGYKK